jgi:hypothetical protein
MVLIILSVKKSSHFFMTTMMTDDDGLEKSCTTTFSHSCWDLGPVRESVERTTELYKLPSSVVFGAIQKMSLTGVISDLRESGIDQY